MSLPETFWSWRRDLIGKYHEHAVKTTRTTIAAMPKRTSLRRLLLQKYDRVIASLYLVRNKAQGGAGLAEIIDTEI